MSKEKELEHKVLMVGSGGVGKSAITIQFVYDAFVEDYEPTKADSYKKEFTIDNEKHTVNILDTAGQEDYASVRDQYFRNGEGFVLVFSLTDQDSFEALKDFYNQITRVKQSSPFSLLIVGNKKDLTRVVPQEDCEGLANQWGCPYIETSAKNKENILECFEKIVKDISANKNLNVRKSVDNNKKKKKKCQLL